MNYHCRIRTRCETADQSVDKRRIAVGKNKNNYWASRHEAASFLVWQPMVRS
jgi:hypothetical protein